MSIVLEDTLKDQHIDPIIKPIMGDIKEAKFILNSPQKYDGKKIFCSANNGQSSHSVTIDYVRHKEYFINEWTQWSSCKNVNSSNTVTRRRKMANDEFVDQKRYCRCSDVKPIPSPRYVLSFGKQKCKT